MLAPMSQLGIGLLADAVGDQLAMGIFGAVPTLVLGALLLRGRRALAQM
jgi:hypothetical protein